MSVVASTLGLQVKCVGFLWRENGRFIENRLLENGVESEFLWLDGAVRTNLKVLDAEQGVVTEINEPGGQVSEEDLEKLTGLVCAQAEDSRFFGAHRVAASGLSQGFLRPADPGGGRATL